MLAVVWAMEHFKHYLLVKNFTLETDHKALLPIFNRERINREYSSRLIQWRHRLLPYFFEVIHAPGKEMGITEYLSRFPNTKGPEDKSLTQEITICQLNFLNDWKNLNLERAIWSESSDPLIPKSRKDSVHISRKLGVNDSKRGSRGKSVLEPIRMLDLVIDTKADILEECVNNQSKSNKTTFAANSFRGSDSKQVNVGGHKPHFKNCRKDPKYFNCKLSFFQKNK